MNGSIMCDKELMQQLEDIVELSTLLANRAPEAAIRSVCFHIAKAGHTTTVMNTLHYFIDNNDITDDFEDALYNVMCDVDASVNSDDSSDKELMKQLEDLKRIYNDPARFRLIGNSDDPSDKELMKQLEDMGL